MSELIIKPRRPRITLWELDKNLDPVLEGHEVCSFTCTYSINQIPYATVTPGVGIDIKTGKISRLQKSIDRIIALKLALGVVVEWDEEPEHATVSTTNKDDDDREKWPKKSIIFKGYAASYTLVKTGTQFKMSLILQHWLQDLAAISMYSPRVHVSSGTNFAADMSRVAVKNPEGTLGGWQLTQYKGMQSVFSKTRKEIDADGKEVDVENTMWDCLLYAIRAVILTANVNMDQCAFGKISDEYLKKQDAALMRFRSCLVYTDNARNCLNTILQKLADTIDKDAADSWVCATAWDKIAGVATSNYYYAIAPTAAWAYVIPTPGTIPATHINLTQDEIIHLHTRTPVAPVLGHVAMVTDNGKPVTYGGLNPSAPIMYPSQKMNIDHLKDSVGGPIATARVPAYLENVPVNYPPKKIVEIDVSTAPQASKTEMKEKARKSYMAFEEMQGDLLRELIALEYFSKVFAGRGCSVTTAFRGDIVPGACVHVHIDKNAVMGELEDVDLYGTVECVTLSIDEGEAITSLELTNVRNKSEYNSEDMYNPKKNVAFYKEQFNGTGATLYCQFKEPTEDRDKAYSEALQPKIDALDAQNKAAA